MLSQRNEFDFRHLAPNTRTLALVNNEAEFNEYTARYLGEQQRKMDDRYVEVVNLHFELEDAEAARVLQLAETARLEALLEKYSKRNPWNGVIWAGSVVAVTQAALWILRHYGVLPT